jgi:hypothetical protein
VIDDPMYGIYAKGRGRSKDGHTGKENDLLAGSMEPGKWRGN